MDDQAETVLLRLMRGSGADGLCGIRPIRTLEAKGRVLLIRPLLSWAKRLRTEDYCRERRVQYRVDEMNEDETFARVRVRKQLLPLLQRAFNPRAIEALARTAELLSEDSATLNAAAAALLAEATVHTPDNEQPPPLRASILGPAPSALRRRALRQWIAAARGDLRRLEMTHLLAVESLLESERGGRTIELPGGATVTRKRWLLRLHLPR
jgi:tRNA(Ile)-lysidine synthase